MSDETQGAETVTAPAKPNPWKEIVQPFVDVWHAPRALWGVNLGYMLEGLAYFGVLGYLAIYFSQEVFAGVANPDTYAHNMVAVLTGGITIAMLFLGFVPDKWGVRRALIWSFVLLVVGRVIIAGAPTILHLRAGLWSPLHLATMLGIVIVVIGYGMYQPAAYAGGAAVHHAQDLGHGLRHALRPHEPGRLVPDASPSCCATRSAWPGHHRHVLVLRRDHRAGAGLDRGCCSPPARCAKAIAKAKADTAREQERGRAGGGEAGRGGRGDERALPAGADVAADRWASRSRCWLKVPRRAGAGRPARSTSRSRCWRPWSGSGSRWCRRPAASWRGTRSPTSSSSSSSSR